MIQARAPCHRDPAPDRLTTYSLLQKPSSLAGGLRLGLRRDNWKVEVELAEEAGHHPVRREQATVALKDAPGLRLLSRSDIFPPAMWHPAAGAAGKRGDR